MVEDSRNNTYWLFIGLYEESETGKHYTTWNLLQDLQPGDGTSWLVMSDFNEDMYSSEKVRGRPRNEKHIHDFREALVRSKLTDLGHKGDFFTWSNKHEDYTFTKEHLDIAVANLY